MGLEPRQSDDWVRNEGPVAKIPLHPKNPERICWGCDKYCPEDAMACGNGTIRTPHPQELFGEDWMEWESREQTDPVPSFSELSR